MTRSFLHVLSDLILTMVRVMVISWRELSLVQEPRSASRVGLNTLTSDKNELFIRHLLVVQLIKRGDSVVNLTLIHILPHPWHCLGSRAVEFLPLF